MNAKVIARLTIAAGLATSGLATGATPALASTGVSGQVECLTMNVEGVWIAASNGGSGWASWSVSDGDPQFANYSYLLPNGRSYAVHVGCGGSSAHWAVPTYSDYYGGTYNSFLCYDQ